MRKNTSTNSVNRSETIITCPFMRGLMLIEGRWKLVVICYLRDYGTQSFSNLKTRMPNASGRMLSKALNELVISNLITRKILPTFPQTVEYSLSPHGIDLLPVIEQLKNWGMKVNPTPDTTGSPQVSVSLN